MTTPDRLLLAQWLVEVTRVQRDKDPNESGADELLSVSTALQFNEDPKDWPPLPSPGTPLKSEVRCPMQDCALSYGHTGLCKWR